MGIFTVQEICKRQDSYKKKLFSEGVDGVQIDAEDEVITLNGWYHVYAFQCKDKESLLSFVAHLTRKNWVTRNHIYWFIKTMSAWNDINQDM